MKFLPILAACLLCTACHTPKPDGSTHNQAAPNATQAKHSQLSQTTQTKLVRVPDAWITKRVQDAKEHLNKSEAGHLVWRSMEAHGGLERWYRNGPIEFQFDYQPRHKGERRNTTQIVDTWRNRAIHSDAITPEARFGWDGKEAWVTMKHASYFNYNLRFWALTPIYFLAQPFNFDGAGVKLERLEDKVLDGISYDAVKISFEAGTGDAPDDFYINYYDKKSHLLKALRYIVSYPAYFKDGGHSPEKIMTLHDLKTVSGIKLPTQYRTYMLTSDERRGDYVTDIELHAIKFLPELKERDMARPSHAQTIENL